MISCLEGDDGGRAGLPAAPAHGLPHGAAPADARVLDEGEKPEAQVLPYRQHPGQTAPQRRQPQGGDQHLLRVSPFAVPEEAINQRLEFSHTLCSPQTAVLPLKLLREVSR